MNFAIILLIFCIWATLAESLIHEDINVPHHAAFASFMEHHGKQYHPSEIASRKRAFIENRKFVHEHNMKFKRGLTSFNVGLNKFADLSNNEFNELISVSSPKELNHGKYSTFNDNKHRARRQNPPTKDWRSVGAVAGAFDQGNCGSSYSFAAVASIEGILKIMSGGLYKLSEQQGVDCSQSYGNTGCVSGTAQNVFKYLKANNNGSIDTLASYPYTSGNSGSAGTCAFKDTGKSKALVTGFLNVPQGEKYLMSAVASIGPIATYCDSSPLSFQFYVSGIYDEPTCSNTTAVQNHWMTVVGYDTSSTGVAYWVVKNSWSDQWGMDGFVKMVRNKGNQCCISCNATYPTITIRPTTTDEEIVDPL